MRERVAALLQYHLNRDVHTAIRDTKNAVCAERGGPAATYAPPELVRLYLGKFWFSSVAVVLILCGRATTLVLRETCLPILT